MISSCFFTFILFLTPLFGGGIALAAGGCVEGETLLFPDPIGSNSIQFYAACDVANRTDIEKLNIYQDGVFITEAVYNDHAGVYFASASNLMSNTTYVTTDPADGALGDVSNLYGHYEHNIATSNNMGVSELKELNNLSSNLIIVGQILILN